MTNSRLTDPEVLEFRFPVRLDSYEIRAGSGGAGRWRGGDGGVRRVRFLEPMTASILSNGRHAGAFGVAGGAPGGLGINRVERADGSVDALDHIGSVEMAAGRRVRDRDARRRRLRQRPSWRADRRRTATLAPMTQAQSLVFAPPRGLPDPLRGRRGTARRDVAARRFRREPALTAVRRTPAARRRRPGRSSACRSRRSRSRASRSSTSTASAPSRSRPICRTATSSIPSRTSPRRRTSPGNGGSRSRSRPPTCARSAATTPRSRSASSSTCRWTTSRSPTASCCAWRAARRASRCRRRRSATSGMRSFRPGRRSTTRSRGACATSSLNREPTASTSGSAEKRDVAADFMKPFKRREPDRAADRRHRHRRRFRQHARARASSTSAASCSSRRPVERRPVAPRYSRGRNSIMIVGGTRPSTSLRQHLGLVDRAQHGLVPGRRAAARDELPADDRAVGSDAHLDRRQRIAGERRR